MPFTVEDFEDLLRLLYERPDWRDRLQRVILPPELFELPRIAQELAESNRAVRERVALLEAEQQATRKELREGFSQTGERLDRVEGRLDGVEGRLGNVEGRLGNVEGRLGNVETELAAFRVEVTERLDGIDGRFDRTDAQLLRVSGDLGTLKSGDMEERVLKRVVQFRHLIPWPVAMTAEHVAALLDDDIASGRLSRGEARQVERSDVIARSDEAGTPRYLVLEISWLVQVSDVRRAHDRAALLRKAGKDALAAVAGTQIEADAVALAERLSVARTIDEELDEAYESVGDETR